MIILAAAFLAAPFVAAYGFYINLLERLKQYLPLQFMLNLAEPVLIAGYVRDRDFDRLCHHNRLLYKFNLLLIMPGLAWIAAIASPLTSLLTGGKYHEYAWILPVLILQLALGSHATIIQIVINAVGKSEILSLSGFSALVAMVIAVALAIGGGHPEYLVLAPLAYEMVNNFVAVASLRGRGFHYDPQWPFHWKLLISTVAAYYLADLAMAQLAHPFAQIAAAALVALAVFVLANALLRTIDARDFQTLKGLLRRQR
jgi:pyruvyl transferase EpsO